MTRTNQRRQAFYAASRGELNLTEEEKKRWQPMLARTWGSIQPDAEPLLSKRGRVAEIIELCLDANRMQMFSGITPEEEEVLCGLWIGKDKVTLKWLRQVLNY